MRISVLASSFPAILPRPKGHPLQRGTGGYRLLAPRLKLLASNKEIAAVVPIAIGITRNYGLEMASCFLPLTPEGAVVHLFLDMQSSRLRHCEAQNERSGILQRSNLTVKAHSAKNRGIAASQSSAPDASGREACFSQ